MAVEITSHPSCLLWVAQGDQNSNCLSSFLQDKKYASDKYKDIYTELSIVKAKADCDISRLKEQLKAATEALGEKSPESSTVSGYGNSSLVLHFIFQDAESKKGGNPMILGNFPGKKLSHIHCCKDHSLISP